MTDTFRPERMARLAIYNRAEVLAAKKCGCYFCQKTFDSSAVVRWTDQDDATALCPLCGIDAVLPGVTDLACLTETHRYWFTDEEPLLADPAA